MKETISPVTLKKRRFAQFSAATDMLALPILDGNEKHRHKAHTKFLTAWTESNPGWNDITPKQVETRAAILSARQTSAAFQMYSHKIAQKSAEMG